MFGFAFAAGAGVGVEIGAAYLDGVAVNTVFAGRAIGTAVAVAAQNPQQTMRQSSFAVQPMAVAAAVGQAVEAIFQADRATAGIVVLRRKYAV